MKLSPLPLSTAIRLGAMTGPQVRNRLYEHDGTCAKGAAMKASGFDLDTTGDDEVLSRFPVSALMVEGPTGAGVRQRYQRVLSHIISLNDYSKWTREQIADWIELIEHQQEAVSLPPVEIGAAP